ncbi:MAG TPA: 4a-hydroxytetrahydrobiopterin dehydratase [Oligoflexia bacterium]|nr:4a-hydroxytetrahydrobiopterin dehydratase [Oligoflexia bacterium]HMR24722.1 4a-hydroxytetrahydrobiopterin dehydratase [Oligoflexia bacterium]
MLNNGKCTPAAPRLNKQDIDQYFLELDSWAISFDHSCIEKEFSFANFRQALNFVNQVAAIAEEENHHPDIYLSWGKVLLMLSTHDRGGLSMNDFVIAAKIDRLI